MPITSPRAPVSAARNQSHSAAQLIARAAGANLPARPDDSHSSLAWDASSKALCAAPLHPDGTPAETALHLGLRIEDLTLLVWNAGAQTLFPLHDVSLQDALAYVDGVLRDHGLKPASAHVFSYELPPAVADVRRFAMDGREEQFSGLSQWYDVAARLLEEIRDDFKDVSPGPGPVRCWPHHFDIATYIRFEDGDEETAKGLGVGLSPGDDAYDQPYYYVTPWPYLDPADLTPAPAPGHWRTEGFVALIATAAEIAEAGGDAEDVSRAFLKQAASSARRLRAR